MNDVPRDELISALLDGELTADERRQAEQLLADDPGCRQLYEELRLVRATVAGLPRYKLEKDISRRVLRRAERKMLLGSAPEQASDKRNPAPAKPLSTAEAIWRRDWRTVLWPALAVAVALLLMFFSPGVWSPPEEQQITNHGAIAEKAPSTGQHARTPQPKTNSEPSTTAAAEQSKAAASVMAESATSGAPRTTAGGISAADRQNKTASSAPRSAADQGMPYIVADVSPEVLRRSGFHEVLKAHEIRLADEPAPRRAPVRLGAPLATPSARPAIEEANRQAAGTTEAAYVITATREQIQRTIAALREQDETYTFVEERSLTVPADESGKESRIATPPQKQSTDDDRTDDRATSAARRFATREDAEAAAKQALRGPSSEGFVAAELITSIFVLRSRAPESTSTDAKLAPDTSPERGRD